MANLIVTPVSGNFPAYLATATRPTWLDITSITNWTNAHKTWTEGNAQSSTMQTLHTIGDLDANKYYNIQIDGVPATSTITGDSCVNGICLADASGNITFTYTGHYSSHTFDITENALPSFSVPASFLVPVPTPSLAPVSTSSLAISTAAPSPSAPTTSASSIGAIFSQIAVLNAKLASLQAQLASVSPSLTPVFTHNLGLWSTGSDVKNLQLFLISENSGPAVRKLKSHGATTIFGILTYNALKEFQASAGITPASGYFGPKTRAYVNALK